MISLRKSLSCGIGFTQEWIEIHELTSQITYINAEYWCEIISKLYLNEKYIIPLELQIHIIFYDNYKC